MKKTVLIIATLITGCTYAPIDDHSKHYLTKNVTNTPKSSSDQDYLQYTQSNQNNHSTPSNAPFYEGGFQSRPIINYTPCYLPPPPRANRSIYYIESNF